MSTQQPTGQLTQGPLQSTVEVVAFIAICGMAWFNAAELILTVLLKFQRWTGRYFWALIVATSGVLIFQIFVFLQTWAPEINIYAGSVIINLGWSAMVTGQSLVLWSRLHLVSRSHWKLKAILYMIIFDAVFLHIPQIGFSLAACDGKTNSIDPTYKPFEVMEKISISMFTVQELIISSVYLYETVRILRASELVQKKSKRRSIQLLFLANLAIISIDVTTIALEFSALWGVWCTFKGFGYSVKLKIEFAILNQLRDSVKQNNGSASGSRGYARYGYGDGKGSGVEEGGGGGIGLGGLRKGKAGFKGDRKTWAEIGEEERITKTTDIVIRNEEGVAVSRAGKVPKSSTSDASSEIEFATPTHHHV
ncbi:hypothetical protein N0V90_007328 [Kalmusia sp. IMI 367209]|nr:hypothetical protein N0V90_007328 [Kalmusia sp. IMI 367209]